MNTPPSVIVAPMAGGPSTPALVDAVRFGFLASGTANVDSLVADMAAVSTDTYGVNLFAPQDRAVPELSFGWEAKLAAVSAALAAGHGPTVVSTTFGAPNLREASHLRSLGVDVWVTVTNLVEASQAAAVADALVVQGPRAGGHRGTWSPTDDPDTRPLPELIGAIAGEFSLPIIAAGGISTAQDVAETLALPGVIAVSCGTAFLLAEEAGTSPFNRELLRRGTAANVLSRAFSGRWARGLETAYTRSHPDQQPDYPYLAARLAARRSEEDFAYCLAGVGYRQAQERPAAEIEKELRGECGE